MAERHPTDNPPAIWPPPPDTPAALAVEVPPPARPRNAAVADVLVYGTVWTLVALMAFGTAWAVVVKSPLAALLLPPIGVMFLVLTWPLNAIWLVCMIGSGLLHRAWLAGSEKRKPSSGGTDGTWGRSVRGGLALGLALAAIACKVSVRLHLPGPYEDTEDDGVAPPVYAAAVTLLMYGVSSWLASVAAGWALGALWARRRVARTP